MASFRAVALLLAVVAALAVAAEASAAPKIVMNNQNHILKVERVLSGDGSEAAADGSSSADDSSAASGDDSSASESSDAAAPAGAAAFVDVAETRRAPKIVMDNQNHILKVERVVNGDEESSESSGDDDDAAAAAEESSEETAEESSEDAAEESSEDAAEESSEDADEESSEDAAPDAGEESGEEEEESAAAPRTAKSTGATPLPAKGEIDLKSSNLFCVDGREVRWIRGQHHPLSATRRVWCPHNLGSCCPTAAGEGHCCDAGYRCTVSAGLSPKPVCVKRAA